MIIVIPLVLRNLDIPKWRHLKDQHYLNILGKHVRKKDRSGRTDVTSGPRAGNITAEQQETGVREPEEGKGSWPERDRGEGSWKTDRVTAVMKREK